MPSRLAIEEIEKNRKPKTVRQGFHFHQSWLAFGIGFLDTKVKRKGLQSSYGRVHGSDRGKGFFNDGKFD